MKIRTMFMTTMLATATVMGFSYDSYAAENIAIETVNTATMPISKAKTQDPRLAAASFVEHVNYARQPTHYSST